MSEANSASGMEAAYYGFIGTDTVLQRRQAGKRIGGAFDVQLLLALTPL